MMYKKVSKLTQNCNRILRKNLLQNFILAITKSVYYRDKEFNKTKTSYISKVKFSIKQKQAILVKSNFQSDLIDFMIFFKQSITTPWSQLSL